MGELALLLLTVRIGNVNVDELDDDELPALLVVVFVESTQGNMPGSSVYVVILS